MAEILKALLNGYTYLYYDLRDKRTDDFWLISTPFPVLGILTLYYYFVMNIGPKFMKDRPPFELKKIIIIYNIAQISLNGYLFFKAMKYIGKLNLWCNLVDYSNDEFAVTCLHLTWLYLVTKIFDLLDTVFFVLRKKKNQISFLHLYHHIIICFVSLIGVRYVGGGQTVYLGILNCFVHIWMYGYYLLAAYDSSYKQNIWWKKYITMLQIVQFFLLFILFVPMVFDSTCSFPKTLVWIMLPQNLLMVILFSQFYYNAYVKPKNKNT